jgi:hypothetical protein
VQWQAIKDVLSSNQGNQAQHAASIIIQFKGFWNLNMPKQNINVSKWQFSQQQILESFTFSKQNK